MLIKITLNTAIRYQIPRISYVHHSFWRYKNLDKPRKNVILGVDRIGGEPSISTYARNCEPIHSTSNIIPYTYIKVKRYEEVIEVLEITPVYEKEKCLQKNASCSIIGQERTDLCVIQKEAC